jgi:hypothetical protein
VARARDVLATVRPLESFRIPPEFQNSSKRRLIFARFEGLPLFWRLDLDVFARSVDRDPAFDADNPAAHGTQWSRAESSLANAVAAVKAHLRGDAVSARALLGRGLERIGLPSPDGDLGAQVLALATHAAAADPSVAGLAGRVRDLALEAFPAAGGGRD